MKRGPRGFTLIELLIGIALIATLLMLVGPSMRPFIEVQRLKGVNAALVTDLQYARSEAASRGKQVVVQFHPGAANELTCYTVYTSETNATTACDCTVADPATRCAAGTTELKTVALAPEQGVYLTIPTGQSQSLIFDADNGGSPLTPPVGTSGPTPTSYIVNTLLDGTRQLRVLVGMSGRPTVCKPVATFSVAGGYTSC